VRKKACPDCGLPCVVENTDEGHLVRMDPAVILAAAEPTAWGLGWNTFQVVGKKPQWRRPWQAGEPAGELHVQHVCLPELERLATFNPGTSPPPRPSIWGAAWIVLRKGKTKDGSPHVVCRLDEEAGVYREVYDVSSFEVAMSMAIRLCARTGSRW